MSEFKPVAGSVVIGNRKRKVTVLVPTLSFCKVGAENATVYTAEQIAADQEILLALHIARNAAIKVTVSEDDETVEVPAETTDKSLAEAIDQLKAANADLTKQNTDLQAANDQLTKEKTDLEAHVQLLQDELTKTKAVN